MRWKKKRIIIIRETIVDEEINTTQTARAEQRAWSDSGGFDV